MYIKVEKRALLCAISRLVQLNVTFSINVRIMRISCNIKNLKTIASLSKSCHVKTKFVCIVTLYQFIMNKYVYTKKTRNKRRSNRFCGVL
jgi:hypothetical protein